MLGDVRSPARIIPYLVFAVLAGCRTEPDAMPVTIGVSTGVLPIALEVAPQIQDSGRRVGALLQISRGLVEVGSPTDAGTVALEAARIISNLPLSDDLVGLQLETAQVLLDLDQIDSARRLIIEATNYATSPREEISQSTLLPAIVRVALAGGDDTRDLLPPIVDPAYVMEDPALRAQTFISIVEQYQAIGLGQSVRGLIQQAIPAIRMVTNPTVRARLFGALALRAFESSQPELGSSLVRNALTDLGAGTDEPNTAAINSVFRSISRERGAADSINAVPRSLSPESRVTALIAIADEASTESGAVLATRRAAEEVSNIGDPQTRASLLAEIAVRFSRFHRDDEAAEGSEQALETTLSLTSASARVQVLISLAGVYATTARPSVLAETARGIGDPYGRALVALEAARALNAEGQFGIAEDFLVLSLEAADESTLLPDELRISVAEGFARAGSYGPAVTTIERITTASDRARATAILARYADPNGGLSAQQLEDLRQILGE